MSLLILKIFNQEFRIEHVTIIFSSEISTKVHIPSIFLKSSFKFLFEKFFSSKFSIIKLISFNEFLKFPTKYASIVLLKYFVLNFIFLKSLIFKEFFSNFKKNIYLTLILCLFNMSSYFFLFSVKFLNIFENLLDL